MLLQSASRHSLTLPRVFHFAILTCIFIVLFYQLRPLHFAQRIEYQELLEISIPEKIWYKLGPKGMNDDYRQWSNSCLSQNPTHTHEIMTDESGDKYVKEKYAYRPDIVENFLNITIPIVKADLLRYLILYMEGGVWSDLDVSCPGPPISEWIPPQFKGNTSVVVGLEFDAGYDYDFERSFSSWTILSKPKSPHMLSVIDSLLEALYEKTAEHNCTAAELDMSMVGDIVIFSGPNRMTKGILKSLSTSLNANIGNDDIKLVMEPKQIGDVLVLPGYAFSNSSNPYDGYRDPVMLVEHHYAGSWKNDHGGEI